LPAVFLLGDAAWQIFKQPAPSLQAKESDQLEPPHEITISAHAILRDLRDIGRGRRSAVKKNQADWPDETGRLRRSRMGSAKVLTRNDLQYGELLAAEAFDN
jgi:hypothetical protein